MSKLFNHITDINGKDKKYLNDRNYVVFFFTEDERYFIYALCTRKDFTKPELIEVSFEKYMDERDSLSFKPIEHFADSKFAVEVLIRSISIKVLEDNITIGQKLKL